MPFTGSPNSESDGPPGATCHGAPARGRRTQSSRRRRADSELLVPPRRLAGGGPRPGGGGGRRWPRQRSGTGTVTVRAATDRPCWQPAVPPGPMPGPHRAGPGLPVPVAAAAPAPGPAPGGSEFPQAAPWLHIELEFRFRLVIIKFSQFQPPGRSESPAGPRRRRPGPSR